MSPSVPAFIKSSTSTQAELVPSTSSVTVASPSKSQPPNSVISAASSASTACSVLETTTTTSNTIPTIYPRIQLKPQNPVGKNVLLKTNLNTIKPKIEVKTTPHRSRKPAPTEYSTDEEDMIVYDVWKMNLR
ncbi:hypothetical protein TNCV_3438061 [Trichonephila clavipes]|nr:hypothetical protein TNCV_3438061 [Trichonephila clavipes]